MNICKSVAMIPPLIDRIPAELREIPNWVVWKGEGDGPKPRKIPYDAKLINSRASSTDPTTWSEFDAAVAAYEEGGRDGIGICLDGRGLAAVDLDGCVHGDVIDPAALKLLDWLGAGYVEISPSGQGLRAFGLAANLQKGVNGISGGLKVELYTDKRYMTVTGRAVRSQGIRPFQNFEQLAASVGRASTPAASSQPDDPHIAQAALLRQIITGEVLHDSIRDLSASLIANGLNAGATVNLLRGVMQLAATKDDRWQDRYKDIHRTVNSAVEKFGGSEENNTSNPKQIAASMGLTAVSDLLQPPPPLQWLVRSYLLPMSITYLTGDPASGKSLLAIDLACCVATGAPWCGKRVRQGAVIYLAGEGHYGIRRRFKAWDQHHKSLESAPIYVSSRGGELTKEESCQALVDEIAALGDIDVQMIVVDTMHRNFGPGDENKPEDIDRFIRNLETLRDRFEAAVVVAHHSGHGAKDRSRGSSAILGAIDAEYIVSKDANDVVSVACPKKFKDGPPPPPRSLAIQQVVLPWLDDEGVAETSAVLVDQGEQVTVSTQDVKLMEYMEVLMRAWEDAGRPMSGGSPPLKIVSVSAVRRHLTSNDHYDQRKVDNWVKRSENRPLGRLLAANRINILDSNIHILE